MISELELNASAKLVVQRSTFIISPSGKIARAALQTMIIPAMKQAGIRYDGDVGDSICELRLLLLAEGAAAAFRRPDSAQSQAGDSLFVAVARAIASRSAR